MTQHIEEARKVWGYFKGGSAGGTEAMQWFDNNKSCGGPAYLIEVFRAALAAAEERGRIEERERCAIEPAGVWVETDPVLVGEIVEAGTAAAQLLYGRDVIFHEQLQRMPVGTKLYAAIKGGEQ